MFMLVVTVLSIRLDVSPGAREVLDCKDLAGVGAYPEIQTAFLQGKRWKRQHKLLS